MKKTNVIKIFKILLILFVFSLICSTKVLASEASVSSSNCNLGDKITVTVNIPQDVVGYDIGGITIVFSDGTSQSSGRRSMANVDKTWPGNYSVTFDAKVAGNATISVNNVILVDSSAKVVNSNSTLQTSITITNPAPATPPAQTNPTTPTNPTSPSTDNNQSNPPAPTVTVNFSNTNETMYITKTVNVRQNCGTEYGIIQKLSAGTQVTRIGVGDKEKNGYSWSKISYNGVTGYVITSALTSEKPADAPEENPEEPATDEEPVVDERDKKLQEMAEEIGTIPEVGLNIMPFMFVGCCVSCAAMMVTVKRNIAK